MDVKVLYLGTESFHLACAKCIAPANDLVLTKSASELIHVGLQRNQTDEEWVRALRAVRRLVALARVVVSEAILVTIASEALCDLPGSAVFFDALWRSHGIRPRFLSEEAETRLTYIGASTAFATPAAQTVVAHFDARSIRLAVGSNGSCVATASAPLGIARLQDAFGRLRPHDERAVAALLRLSAGPAVAAARRMFPEKVVIASTLARPVRHIARAWGFMGLDEVVLCRVGLHALAAAITKTPARELGRLGLDPTHAVTAGLSAVVIDSLADLFEASEVTFTDRGAPEGVALYRLHRSTRKNAAKLTGLVPGSFEDQFRRPTPAARSD